MPADTKSLPQLPLPETKPRRPSRPKKTPAPVAGRLEDARQQEMFPDLPHLEEPVPADWEAP